MDQSSDGPSPLDGPDAVDGAAPLPAAGSADGRPADQPDAAGDATGDAAGAPLALRYAALSDVGQVRKDNQDSGFASEHLLLVADGVGGAVRGDVASSTAVQVLRRLDETPAGNLLEALAGALHRTHDRIAELVEQDPSLDGTSTTITSALFDGSRIGIAHVGDSRGYLLRDGTLSQLTRDHTFVQSLVDEGRITEEESRSHPHRNLILRAVDGIHETDPDLFTLDLAPGDRLLLCSDGACGVLDRERLADILGTGTVDYAVVELVRASLEAGSSDNVTCVVADVVDVASGEGRTGAVVVGAAADQSRRGGKNFFRGHRGGDTGEIEPVPADAPDGATVTDPEELRYAPREPRRGRWARRVAALVVLVAVLAAAGVLGYRWTQQQYYVSASGGKVAIFRGVQADVPGVTLTSVVETTDVTVAALPDFSAGSVKAGISAKSLPDARRIVGNLSGTARVCPTPTPTPTSTATPRASSSATAKASRSPSKASGSATPSTTGSASPSPSPTSTLAPPDCIEAGS